MDKLTSNSPDDYQKYDNRTLIIITTIRQAKLRQEMAWLKRTTVLASTAVGVMQALTLLIDLLRGLL